MKYHVVNHTTGEIVEFVLKPNTSIWTKLVELIDSYGWDGHDLTLSQGWYNWVVS